MFEYASRGKLNEDPKSRPRGHEKSFKGTSTVYI